MAPFIYFRQDPIQGFAWNDIKVLAYLDKRFRVKPLDKSEPVTLNFLK